MTIYSEIIEEIKSGIRLIAVLIDPDKIKVEDIAIKLSKINQSCVTHIFVGGSTVEKFKTQIVVEAIKRATNLPVIIFPGDTDQITDEADALLFLSLISGRNPEYLIGKHIEAVPILSNINLEVIPTSYILVGQDNHSAVERVSGTKPLSFKQPEIIVNTAKAGELLGHKLVYIEAGSGATQSVTPEIIRMVKRSINIPLIIGGGIKNVSNVIEVFNSGADMAVIGTAFEKDIDFFEKLKIESSNPTKTRINSN